MKKVFGVLLLLMCMGAIPAFGQALPWPSPGTFVTGGSGGTVPKPVLELYMDEATGTIAHDSSGCGNDFTITAGTGGWTTLTGVSRGVYQFDGTTTKMAGANFTCINFDWNQPFSIFAVFQRTTGGTTQPIFTHTTTNHRGYDITLESGQLAFLLSNVYPTAIDIHCFSCPGFASGALHDVLVTYNGNGLASGVKFYEDGTDYSANPSIFQNSLGGNPTTTSTVPNVGFRPEDSQFWKGYIGPIYVWNQVLTSGNASTLHSDFYAPH